MPKNYNIMSLSADFLTEDLPFLDPTMRSKMQCPSGLHSSIQSPDLKITDLKTRNFYSDCNTNTPLPDTSRLYLALESSAAAPEFLTCWNTVRCKYSLKAFKSNKTP